MKAKVSSAQYSTVSYLFIEDWLYALRLLCTEEKYLSFLKHADLTIEHNLSAVETGDEMIGLWKRPIRARALQHLLKSVCEATSLTSALYRFSTFWNLFLDEYQFTLNEKDNRLVLAFEAQDESTLQRFGHMLILKLAHGFISWLDRKEVPVSEVGFAFDSPNFADDYSVIFPSLVKFSCRQTFISFDLADLGPVQIRSTADLDLFLENAPRDWIFPLCALSAPKFLHMPDFARRAISGTRSAKHIAANNSFLQNNLRTG